MTARMSLGALAIALTMGFFADATPVTAVLGLKSRVSMQTLAQDVSNPSSPRYQKYYTPEEIRTFAAPSQGEYEAFLTQLQQEGFSVVSESTTHLWVSVQADSSIFENVFNTQIQTDIQGTRRVLTVPQVPQRLALVERVIGLDNRRHSVPKYVMGTHAPGGTGTADDGGGIPQATIKSAYGFNAIYESGLNATGQHIAVATFKDFTLSDVSSFYRLSNLNPLPTVDQVIFNGTPEAAPESAIETEMDAEFSGMMAPGAAVHVFTSATNDDAGEIALFTAILDDGRSHVVNYSWGDCETNVDSAHMAAMEPILERAVAQGVNIMVASGDNGSADCYADNKSTKTVADFPSANPNVIAVGGTSFLKTANGVADTAWTCTAMAVSKGCSGGGVSTIWPMPTYQNGILPSRFSMRGYPDVAFNADPATGEDIYVTYRTKTARWTMLGGTSMAAPQWVGFMALVEAARAAKGLAPLGFGNPLWYGATASQRATLFNDVTTGSNGAYNAGPGWDPVTGFGSMQAHNLLNFLTSN